MTAATTFPLGWTWKADNVSVMLGLCRTAAEPSDGYIRYMLAQPSDGYDRCILAACHQVCAD